MPPPPRPPVRGNYTLGAAIFAFVGAAFVYSAGFAVKQEDVTNSDLEDYRARQAEAPQFNKKKVSEV